MPSHEIESNNISKTNSNLMLTQQTCYKMKDTVKIELFMSRNVVPCCPIHVMWRVNEIYDVFK